MRDAGNEDMAEGHYTHGHHMEEGTVNEAYSDLMGVRLDMLDKGIYDFRTEQMTLEHWQTYLKHYDPDMNTSNENYPISLQRLLYRYRVPLDKNPDKKRLIHDIENTGDDKDSNIRFLNNTTVGITPGQNENQDPNNINDLTDLTDSQTRMSRTGGPVKFQTKGSVEVELNQGEQNLENDGYKYQALIYIDPTDPRGYFTGDYERMIPELNKKYGEGNYKLIELPTRVHSKEWEDKKTALNQDYEFAVDFNTNATRFEQLNTRLTNIQRRENVENILHLKERGVDLSDEDISKINAYEEMVSGIKEELNTLQDTLNVHWEDEEFMERYLEVYAPDVDRGWAAGSDAHVLGLFDDIGNLNPKRDIIIMQHGNDKIGPLVLSEGDRKKHGSDWSTPNVVDTFSELLAEYNFEGTCYGGVCGDNLGEEGYFKRPTSGYNLAVEVPGLTTKFAIGTWSGFQDIWGDTFDKKFFNNIYSVVSPTDNPDLQNVTMDIINDPENKDHRPEAAGPGLFVSHLEQQQQERQAEQDRGSIYKKGGTLYKKGGRKKSQNGPYKKPPITATDREKRMYWLRLNSDKNFVQRILNPELNRGKEVMNPQDGLPMTHYMTSMDNIVFPMVIDRGDGTFHHFKSEDEAYQYAMQTGEYIRTDTEEEAIWLGKNYKTQEFNIAHGNPKYKKGGVLDFLSNFKFKPNANITKYQTQGAVDDEPVLGENKSDGYAAGPLYTTNDMQSDYKDEVLLSYLIDQALRNAGIDMDDVEAVKKGRENIIYAMNRISRTESLYSPKENDAGTLQYDEVGDLMYDGDTAALGIYQIKVPTNIHPQELTDADGKKTGKWGKGPMVERMYKSAQQNYKFYDKLGLIVEGNEPGNKYQHTFLNELLEHNDPRKLTKTQQDLMFLTSMMYGPAPFNAYITATDENRAMALENLYFDGWHASDYRAGKLVMPKKNDPKYEEKKKNYEEKKEDYEDAVENWHIVNEVFDNDNYREIKVGIHDDYPNENKPSKKGGKTAKGPTPWSFLNYILSLKKEQPKEEKQTKRTGGAIEYQNQGFVQNNDIFTRHDNVGTQSNRFQPLPIPKGIEGLDNNLSSQLNNLELLLDTKKEEIENKFFSVSEIFPNMKKWKRLYKGIDLVDINVITALDELAKILPGFENMDLEISSALRSEKWNKDVGGRYYSRHLFGMGLDIIGKDAKKLTQLLLSSENPQIVAWRKKWTSDKHGHSGRGVIDEWASGNHLHLQFKDVLGTGANYQTYSKGNYTTLNNYNKTFDFSSSFARSTPSAYSNTIDNILTDGETTGGDESDSSEVLTLGATPTDQVEQHQSVIRTARDDFEGEEEEDWRLELHKTDNEEDEEKELTLLDNITFNRSTQAFQNAHSNSFLDAQNQIFLPYQSPFGSGKRAPQLWGYDDPAFITALNKRNAELEEMEKIKLGLQNKNENKNENVNVVNKNGEKKDLEKLLVEKGMTNQGYVGISAEGYPIYKQGWYPAGITDYVDYVHTQADDGTISKKQSTSVD